MPCFTCLSLPASRRAASAFSAALCVFGGIGGLALPSASAQETPPATAPAPATAADGGSAADAAPPAPVRWKSAGFQIAYTPPPGYQIVPNVRGTAVTFQGPSVGGIRATIAIQRTQTGGATLEAMADGIARQMAQIEPDLRVMGKAGARVGGDEVYRMDTLGTGRTAKSEGHLLQSRQVFVTHEGRTFNFLLAADPGAFAQEATAFERSLASVAWSVVTPAENIRMVRQGFTATVPENWRRIDPSAPDGMPQVALLIAGVTVDDFCPSFVVDVKPSAGMTTLPVDWAETLLARERATKSDFHYTAQTQVAIDGVPALVLDAAFHDASNGHLQRTRAVYLIRNQQLYTFLFSSSDRGFTAEAEAAFAKFMTSIRWAQPGSAESAP